MQLWLALGSGNANFFYGMNLVLAAWHALALVQLVKAGVKADAGVKPATADVAATEGAGHGKGGSEPARIKSE